MAKVDAVYASPLERDRGDRGADRHGARAEGARSSEGLLECDFGEWTGGELKALIEAARVADGAALPERLPVPRRREVHRDADPHRGRRSTASSAAHPGGASSCVSHADPIKAAVAHALGTHLDLFQRIVISPCSVTAIAYGEDGPAVLTVNSANGTLAELKAS